MSDRNRYIYFQIISNSEDKKFSKDEIIKKIKSQCISILKTNSYSLGIRLIKFDGTNGIIKCKHIEKDNTIKLLKSIEEISSNKVTVETFGTSGTIKALIRKYMNNKAFT